ncbi:hypothetical protein CASFOL_033054 [Castilleja foliolosa]|uniref:DUF1985 domain-containing protein n=1 Tax=Castilleja foliolosa TaxID=1961234 RepID=A0ABD3C397_9LAMI
MDAATTEINASASACETTVLQSANTSSSSSPPSSISPAADDSFPTSDDQSPPTVAEDVSDHASELLNRWSWVRPEFKEQRAVINGYVRLNHLAEIRSQLKKNHEAYTKFQGGCFGRYLEYCTNKNAQCPNTAMHAMLGQQVNRQGAGVDELWFRVGDQFLRFSKYEYALVTGLKFGHTDFDPNEDYSYPSDGVYKRKICRGGRGGIKLNDLVERFAEGEFAVSTDDQLKISKVIFVCSVLFGEDNLKKLIPEWLWVLVEDEDKWENFPWGSYTFQILYSKIQQVPLTRSPEAKKFAYHFYGFCHAFAHWIFEAVPPLASLLMSKNRRPDPQRPRLLKWPLPAEKKSLDNFFKDEVHKECLETLEPTVEELIDYPWWSHVADDVRSHVQYVQRESPFTDSNVGAPAASNAIVPADVPGEIPPNHSGRSDHTFHLEGESSGKKKSAGAPQHSLRERKRARSDSEKVTQLVKEFMLRMRRDIITAVEEMRQESANNLEKAKQDIADTVKDVRQGNANYIQEWKQETAEIKDGFKQELTVIADNIVERITQNNAVSIEQANSEIKACMEQLRHNVMVRFQQMVPEPSNCNPTFDSAPDLPFVPFEDSFDEQLDAYTDPCDTKEAYVLSRGGNEALMTPIKIPLPATKELTPIRVDSDQLNSLLDPVVRFARPLRPTVAFKGSTFWMNKKQSKEMDAYRNFMASDSDEL